MTIAKRDEIQDLINKNQRRLQKLKEKEAMLGVNTPPEILIEIEDIEEEIKSLREELRQLNPSDSSPGLVQKSEDGHINDKRQSSIEVLVAKIGLTGTVIAALIGLIGVGVTAYFGYLGIQAQINLPIEATQTAEAKASMAADSITPTSQSTSVTTPGSTLQATPAANPAPTDTPTMTPTREAPPTFISEYVYDLAWETEQTEFDFEPGMLPTDTITDFLRLSRVALGSTESPGLALNVRLTIKNTGSRPLLLDLDERFFELEDDQGRQAELLYFCCASEGDILGVGQERDVQMIFAGSGWIGKEVSANALFLRVRGLLPVVRASWRIHTLATAE